MPAPLGILLFFWQWERLIFYHIDYKAGTIPEDIALLEYLAVFLTPAVVMKWQWGATVGQGYTYLQNAFYAEDKSRPTLRPRRSRRPRSVTSSSPCSRAARRSLELGGLPYGQTAQLESTFTLKT